MSSAVNIVDDIINILSTEGKQEITNVNTTFYRRTLPCPPAIKFSSDNGREIFFESLKDGYMNGYFKLSEQFRTQDEPSFCGISTLTMALNTLEIDPNKVWKGPWRWYHESMLNCCKPLNDIKRDGIVFKQFICLAKCNGLNVVAKKTLKLHIYNDKKELTVKDRDFNGEMISDIDTFRNDVILACKAKNGPILIVSYSRKEFKQTGDGHFSCIGGYNGSKDMILIMDVARFKYPPHWVKLTEMYNSMSRIDKSTNDSRGWILLSNAKKNIQSVYFMINNAYNNVDYSVICDTYYNIINQLIHKLNDAHGNQLSTDIIIQNIIKVLPQPIHKYIITMDTKYGFGFNYQHNRMKQQLLNQLHQSKLYKNITKLVNKCHDSEYCFEIYTIMIFIIDVHIWDILPNKQKNDIKNLLQISRENNNILYHEIYSIKTQLSFIQDYFKSINKFPCKNRCC